MISPSLRPSRVHPAIKMVSITVLAAALATFSASAHAQDSAAQAAPNDSGSTDASLPAEIVVTGSRIALAPGALLPTPTTVIDQSTMRALGIANVGDAVLQMPAMLNDASPTQTTALSPQNIGSRIADLRGLGATRTLVLIDGRRFVPSTASGTVDLALIPSAIISRAEVVTGGASAAYGSDAVAGVINLITDTQLRGLRGQFQKGIAQEGDNARTQASLAGGVGFGDGRGSLVGAAEYEQDSGQGDYYSRKWSASENCQLQNHTDPTKAVNLNVPNCHTGYLTAPGLIVGGPLNDQQFSADGKSLVPFVPGLYRGFFMEGGSGAGDNAFFTGPMIAPEYKRYSLYAHTDFKVSDLFQPYIDVSYGSITGHNVGAQGRFSIFTGGGLTLTADNPYLPNAVRSAIGPNGSISVGKALNDLGNALGRSQTSTFRVVGGAKGNIGSQWHWNAYYQHGRTNYNQELSNNIITSNLRQAVDAVEQNGKIVCRDPSGGCQPYNPLGINNFTSAAKAFVTGTSTQKEVLTQDVFSGDIGGNLFNLPGGPLAVDAGIEHRRDSFSSSTDPLSLAGAFYTFNGSDVAGKVAVTEAFGEVNAPLLANIPLVKSLSLNGAVRRTHYSTSGNVTTWKAGGVYEPASFLRFRATRSHDIRAPNTTELFSPLVDGQAAVTDPTTSTQVLVPIKTGGNPELLPEIANTTTAGIIIKPFSGARDSLYISLDYYNIKVRNVIAQTGPTNIISLCQAGSTADCARITRNNMNAITLITDNFANLNVLKTSGFDLELNYRHSLPRGSITFKGLANYVSHLETTYTATSTTIDFAGQTGNSNFGPGPGVPHFQATTYLTWASGAGTSITVQNRFIGKGLYDVTQIGPDQAGYNVSLPNSSNDNNVPSRLYTNLSLTQTVPAWGRGSVDIYLVINNLFDKDPPIASGAASTTNGILFDQMGRSFTAGARFKF